MKTSIEHRRSRIRALAIFLPLIALAPAALSQSVPPPSNSSAGPPMAAAGGLYFYPKNGQSADQQAADRYACYTWAVNESKFEPAGGAGTGQNGSGLADFRRAMRACLEGRGYSVSAAPAQAPSAPPVAAPPGPVKPSWIESRPELTYHPLEVQIDGGYTVAAGTTSQTLSGGANAGVGLIWFPAAALPAGIRVEGSWSRFDIKDRALTPGFSYGREDIYGGDADLQLDLAHRSSRSKLYLLGGMGWYRMQTRLRQVAYESGTACGWYYCVPGYFPAVVGERNTTSDWQRSWNAGIGWEAAIAPSASFFIEARYRHFLANGNHMSFVPISVGFRF
jgi:opacity protein-like surface antigen